MDWFLACMGNAKGTVTLGGHAFSLDASNSFVALPEGLVSAGPIVISSERGKLADSEDSLLFLGTRIDPRIQDVSVAARIAVTQVQDDIGWLSGYGMFALDTVASADAGCRHRNMASAGRHRALDSQTYEYGLRAVAGHASPEAKEFVQGRILDASRTFPRTPAAVRPAPGDVCELRLEKRDGGLVGWASAGEGAGELRLSGCDFLAVQEPDALYLGVGVAGDISVEVEGLALEVSAGNMAHLAHDELRLSIPSYPFPRSSVPGLPELRDVPRSQNAVYAAPEGRPDGFGSLEDPVDLQTALMLASWRRQVVLLDGTYCPMQTLVARQSAPGGRQPRIRVVAQHPGAAVLDGSALPERMPILLVEGSGWHVRGLVACNGPASGILVCGNNNLVERCEAHHNGDTGILVCALPGTPREAWPAGNEVRSCDAYENRDASSANADGFGAKLRVGEGNRFVRCIAHHNADDGFDLYAKSVFGPTGAVELVECVAYENGHVSGEEAAPSAALRGMGFKLGGENQAVAHVARGCIAYRNGRAGFSTNSNPCTCLEHIVAWDNGTKPARHDIRLTTGRTDMTPEWEVVDAQRLEGGKSVAPVRLASGRIDLERLVEDSGARSAQEGERRRRLMFVVPRSYGGGAERVLTMLASRMAEDNEVFLVTTLVEDPERSYEVSPRVKRINLPEWMTTRKTPGARKDQLSGAARLVRIARKRLGKLEGRLLSAARRLSSVLPAGWGISSSEQKLRSRAKALRELKRELGVDCAVSFLNSANYLNVLSRGEERCIVSVRSHLAGPFAPGDCTSEEGHERVMISCHGADAVVAVSRELAHELEHEFGIPAEQLRVVYNGVDVSAVRQQATAPLDDEALAAAMEAACPVFVTTGRLTKKKGQWHLVRAFSRVVEHYPNALLVVLGGEGKGDADVSGITREAVRVQGLESNVVLAGFHKNPHAVVARSDVFVSASLNEGFPNVVIEAMAAGVPVICTDCSSGPREILAPETDPMVKTQELLKARYGILVPTCSGEPLVSEPLEPAEEQLAHAMLLMADNEEIRARFAKASLERANQLSSRAFLRGWEEVIGNVRQP